MHYRAQEGEQAWTLAQTGRLQPGRSGHPTLPTYYCGRSFSAEDKGGQSTGNMQLFMHRQQKDYKYHIEQRFTMDQKCTSMEGTKVL